MSSDKLQEGVGHDNACSSLYSRRGGGDEGVGADNDVRADIERFVTASRKVK